MKFKKPKKFNIFNNIVRSDNVYVGMKVKRGPDWKWGGQDWDGQLIGEVVDLEILPTTLDCLNSKLDEPVQNWVLVKWILSNNESNNYYYRIGPNYFDLTCMGDV